MNEIIVNAHGESNRIEHVRSPGKWPEGTVVKLVNPDTGEYVSGVFTVNAGCGMCIFCHYTHCPRVPGYGCIACAIKGGFGKCAIVSLEDLI